MAKEAVYNKSDNTITDSEGNKWECSDAHNFKDGQKYIEGKDYKLWWETWRDPIKRIAYQLMDDMSIEID